MKKLFSLLLVTLMLLSLAACGGSAEPDPNCGLYEAESASMGSISVDIKTLFEDGFSIELNAGGRAKFNHKGKSYSMKWTLEGDAFSAKGGGAELFGTLSDGVMELENVLDSGINLTLVNKDYQASSAA